MKQETKQSIPVIVTAIIAIAVLEAIALYKGINGKILIGAMTVIGALGGVQIGKYLQLRSLKK